MRSVEGGERGGAYPRPLRPPRLCPPRPCPTGRRGGRRKRRGARGRERRGAVRRGPGATRSPRRAAAGARTGMRGNGSGRRRSSSRSSSTWSPCKERRRGGCPGGWRSRSPGLRRPLPALPRRRLGRVSSAGLGGSGGDLVFILSLAPRKAGACSLPAAAAPAPSHLKNVTHFYTEVQTCLGTLLRFLRGKMRLFQVPRTLGVAA